ncbi:hypothetical protein [Streptacidiphilus sp. EB129]|uniref:hypothetical protein n=1 Tax=Streptacidiphilus sp. EB129 TaxID=3156262 RepID=UPI003516ED6D
MEAIAIVLGLLVVLLGGVAALTGLVVVKTKRALTRAAPQARRAAEDVAIKARSLTRGGAHGKVAGLRGQVRSALAASRRVLESGAGDDPQLVESLRLLARLDGHADELDGELRLLEREPDLTRVEARLAVARERAERIVHLASSLRWAAQDRMHRFADDDLQRLGEECEAEAGALRHWAPAGAVPQAEDVAGLDPARERSGALGALGERLRKPRPGASAG